MAFPELVSEDDKKLCGRWYRDLPKRGEGDGFAVEAEGKLTECPLALCVSWGGWSIQTCLLLAFDMVTDCSVHKESDFVTVLQSTELDGATNVSSSISRDRSPNLFSAHRDADVAELAAGSDGILV